AAAHVDMVFLAMDATETRLVRPFVGGGVTAYATSLGVNPRADPVVNLDEERLYALGIDACRLALLLLRGEARRTPLDGVTGRITLDGNTFVRALVPVQVDSGKVVPLKAP